MTRILHVLTIFSFVLGAGFARAAAADPKDAKDVKRIENLTRVALEDYDLGDFEAARKGLEGALQEIKVAKLEAHPIAATANLYLGAVYVVGLKDTAKGTAFVKAAFAIDPKVVVPPAMKNPQLDKVIE